MREPDPKAPLLGAAAISAALVAQNIGAAFAKTLFPVFGAAGTAALRVGLAAIVLAMLIRPWRVKPSPSDWPGLVAYGLCLGGMNLLIYEAFARLPIGVAIAIEVTGPLLVATFGARRIHDLAWPALATAGLCLLLPIGTSRGLDPQGLLCAAGAALCWAGYIVAGKRAAMLPQGAAVAWGMAIACLVVLPAGAGAGFAALTPALLGAALAVALLSSALPYSLEMAALRRLPAATFGVFLSTAPVIGALAGRLVLGERLSPLHWLAILLVVLASAGAALSAARR